MSPTQLTSPPVPAPGAALLLAAHAASRDDGAAEPVLRHAASLRRRHLFAEVGVGFIAGRPGLEQALAAVTAETVYVVPCFMADGHYTRTVIPGMLDLAGPQAAPGRIRYCAPLGTSPRVAELVRRRVTAACRARNLRPTAVSVLLVGHGTPRNAQSSSTARGLAGTLGRGRVFAEVGTAFLDEPPSVSEALAALHGDAVVAVGLFAAEGAHGAEDVRTLLAAAGGAVGRASEMLHYAGALGAGPGVIGLILERIQAFEAANAG